MKQKFLPLLLLLTLLTGCAAPVPAYQAPEEGSSFAVHYIDVGQADAALVECDGHYMLIDGGNAADSDQAFTFTVTLTGISTAGAVLDGSRVSWKVKVLSSR